MISGFSTRVRSVLLQIVQPWRGQRASVLLLVATGLLLSACEKPALPATDSAEYQGAVTAFFSSIASIQSGEDIGAEENLLRVTNLAPGEPAAWYNLGLLSLRQNKFDEARERLLKANTLAPENADILRLLGIMEVTQGNMEAGLDYLRQAVTQNPGDYKARFALAQEFVRSGDPAQLLEAAAIYNQLADELPHNLVVLVEKGRLAAQLGNLNELREAADLLDGYAGNWSAEIREPYAALQEAVAGSDAAGARMQAGFLRNMLLSTYSFRQDLLQVQTPTEEVGDLIDRFILLPSPTSQPAPADLALAYSAMASTRSETPPLAFQAVSVDGEGPFDMLSYAERQTTIAYMNEAGQEGRAQVFGDVRFPTKSVSLLDFNYDFLVDLALVGDTGVKLLVQDSTGGFTTMPSGGGALYNGDFTNSWVADIDLEGDLDLVLAGEDGAVILRNNGDGTFDRRNVFPEVQALVDFAWGDFDGDGDPDAALLDAAGEVYLYANDRLGDYTQQIIPPVFGEAIALAVADTDADALMELVVLMRDGAVYSLAEMPGEVWIVGHLFTWDGYVPSGTNSDGLFVHDFDNNGAVDVLLAGASSQVWLSNGPGSYEAAGSVDGIVQSVADLNADGLLDLTGINASGDPAIWQASGTMDYHWQVLRPRAGQALGDQRINSFTIGGEVEIRAGLLYQKQPILSPVVHLGLGTHEKTDVARLIWPNGDIQSEFDLAADQSIFTPQRLKGSCPWLFTYDGENMRFVTDFIWRSPLGLRINAQETAGTVTTEDWVKIRGDELVPRDGYYDIRITAELWETHFFDHVSLLAVDHPEDTEIYIDERFGFPPPEMKIHHTTAVKPVVSVVTDTGDDAIAAVATRDGQYLDFFGRGMYQGITRMHSIEIELPEDALAAANPVLVAFGWVRPTDSSINVAISQGGQDKPQGLILEVQQADGSWRMIRDDLGFPAGKTKTILIDLTDAFAEGDQPRVRLSTNLEVYWDHIGWATTSAADMQITRVDQQEAELVYRGFSKVTAADASSPETPDYQVLEGTGARWRDLVGYYTRFGAVDTLLAQTDDRYVIMNAGDEMRFRFEALPAPPAGWTRDFVLVGDGWVKDGDYNTAFGKTVLPLPTHADPSYDRKPGTLVDDPVYQQHAADWQQYHTRYVTPDRFREALARR